MTLFSRYYIPVLVCICILSSASSAVSQTRYEFTPRISVAETYDDNIGLSSTNEVSDYLTTVTPSILVNILSEKTDLNLRYGPTFVWYAEADVLNTVRHSGTLSFQQQLQQYLRFNLSDTYIKSEDPLEDIDDLTAGRNTRNEYERNNFGAALSYLFGRRNVLNFGYRNNYIDNKDPTLDDYTIQVPLARFTYWFNIKDGFELYYSYVKADFSREARIPKDDFQGHAPGIRYLHRFSPRADGFIGYNFTDRDFEGLTEDYTVHEGLLGFSIEFSPELSLSAEGGYFIQRNERSPNVDGPSFELSLVKTLERGRISISGDGGWSEDYLSRTRRDFVQYYGARARLSYRLMERLNGSADAVYRLIDRKVGADRDFLRGTVGLGYTLLPWLTLSLDYARAVRNDDIPQNDYVSNRVTLRLTAGKLYRL